MVEILRLMYKLGGRTPLIPPPKEIDARAKASAVGEVKNAVKESAGGYHWIALPNKKGPGWDIDGLDGEIQAASAEVIPSSNIPMPTSIRVIIRGASPVMLMKQR